MDINQYILGYIEARRWFDAVFDPYKINELVDAVWSSQNKFMVKQLPVSYSDSMELKFVAIEPYAWFMRTVENWVRVPKYTKPWYKETSKKLRSFAWWVSYDSDELMDIFNANKYKWLNMEWKDNLFLSEYAKSFIWAMDRLNHHKFLTLEWAFWTALNWMKEFFVMDDTNIPIDIRSWRPPNGFLTTETVPVKDLGALTLTNRWGSVTSSTADPSKDMRNWIRELENYSWLEIDKIYMNRATADALCDTPVYKNSLIYQNSWITTWVRQDPNDFLTKIWDTKEWQDYNGKIIVYDEWFVDYTTVPSTKTKFIPDGKIFLSCKSKNWMDKDNASLVYWPNMSQFFFWETEWPNWPFDMPYVIWDYIYQKRNPMTATLDINLTTTCNVMIKNPKSFAKVQVF